VKQPSRPRNGTPVASAEMQRKTQCRVRGERVYLAGRKEPGKPPSHPSQQKPRVYRQGGALPEIPGKVKGRQAQNAECIPE